MRHHLLPDRTLNHGIKTFGAGSTCRQLASCSVPSSRSYRSTENRSFMFFGIFKGDETRMRSVTMRTIAPAGPGITMRPFYPSRYGLTRETENFRHRGMTLPLRASMELAVRLRQKEAPVQFEPTIPVAVLRSSSARTFILFDNFRPRAGRRFDPASPKRERTQ